MALTNAYAIEAFFCAWAIGTALYVWRMVIDTQLDYEDARQRKAPRLWISLGRGQMIAERWRLVHVLCLLWIGLWMVSHPPPSEARDFFDSEQFTVGRVFLVILIVTKGMAARTERRYREKARLSYRNPHDHA